MNFLERILADVRSELAAAKSKRPLSEIKARLIDAPPALSLPDALTDHFGLIAEIKQKSPSVGPMRPENVQEAPAVYEAHPLVRAVSILTNFLHFGMSVEDLGGLRNRFSKPILRKDFMVDEYQIREARAFGADAILLMANVLDAPRLQGFYDLTRELGMAALFEVHEAAELELLPKDAKIIGINSRKFKAKDGFVGPQGQSQKDFSLDYSAFQLADQLPTSALRIAESGLSPENIASVRNHFHAALVGTSLLRSENGPEKELNSFSEQL